MLEKFIKFLIAENKSSIIGGVAGFSFGAKTSLPFDKGADFIFCAACTIIGITVGHQIDLLGDSTHDQHDSYSEWKW
ncbi:MAG: hypothetical protein K0R02_860 [Rickettsiaceae bacterium]|jgi:hypothetical protein|nr:hypothetical protein [Rickettsiaceae bacterium]